MESGASSNAFSNVTRRCICRGSSFSAKSRAAHARVRAAQLRLDLEAIRAPDTAAFDAAVDEVYESELALAALSRWQQEPPEC